jgi:hypothetical protein
MSFDSSLFYFAPKITAVVCTPSPYDDWTDDDLLELFNERAAIAEFDGKLDRSSAEAAAMEFVENSISRRRYEAWSNKPATQKQVAPASTKEYTKDGRQSCKTDDRVNH